jgi:hypothetical protein
MYTTRHFWRLLLLALVVYLATTRIPWGEAKQRAAVTFQRIEQSIKTIGIKALNSLDEAGERIKKSINAL